MNIRQAAQGLQLMDDYLDEASPATVLGDVRVMLREVDLLREVAHKLREQLAAATDANISLLLDEERHEAEIGRLQELLAVAYQLAGFVDADVRFLDAFSRCEGTCESLLPVTDDDIRVMADNERLREALEASELAIDDWLHTYAPEFGDADRVRQAQSRIFNRGGAIPYIGETQRRNRAALKESP
jgi:hypothetical protein